MAHDQWMPPFVPAPTPTPTTEPRQTRTYETGDAVPAEQAESPPLDEASLTERSQGSLATPVYVPPTAGARATARREEEAYQEGIKQRAALGEALTPDEIHRRARQAGSLAR